MSKSVVVSASQSVTGEDVYLLSVILTAGIDVAHIRIREKDATGPVRAEVKAIANSTASVRFEGVFMPGGIFVEVVSGTGPSVTVEFK